jgi:sugar-specific transcriptional regulator TrmB
MLEKTLTNIGLSANSQQIYILLIKHGEMAARIISQKTGLPRTTVYDGLTPLINLGLVILKDEDGHSVYGVGDPNTLELILDEKITLLSKTKNEIHGLVNSLREKTTTLEPKVRFFSGNEGIKKILNDILWYKNVETYTLWPMKQMLQVLGEEYLEWHNIRRVQRNIGLKSLRISSDKIDFKKFAYLAGIKENLREIRYTPKNIKITMSYWIYADKVAFVSTGDIPFGFIVHSKDFAEMMKVNFHLMWEVSNKK